MQQTLRTVLQQTLLRNRSTAALSAVLTLGLGSRHIKLQPEQDGSCESDGREEDLRAPVIASGYTAPALQASEHNLDPVTGFVAALVVSDRFVARFSTRNTGFYSLVCKGFAEPIGIIAAITQ